MVSLYAKALRLSAASVKTPDESAGPAVVATGSAGEAVYTPEVWGVSGIYSVPPDDTMGIRVPVGSERFGVVMATHHYKTPRPTLTKGEAALASTDATGGSLMARVQAYADGKISASNATTDLLTLLNGLIDNIKAIVTVGTAATQTVNPASQAALEAYKAQFATLLKTPV